MNDRLNPGSFLSWMFQEAMRLAHATSNGGDPFPELWGVAIDALDRLRHAPDKEQAMIRQSIQQCLDTGSFDQIVIPKDEHEADCFVTLLRWVLNPPPVL